MVSVFDLIDFVESLFLVCTLVFLDVDFYCTFHGVEPLYGYVHDIVHF